jgi:hypothetical protein
MSSLRRWQSYDRLLEQLQKEDVSEAVASAKW